MLIVPVNFKGLSYYKVMEHNVTVDSQVNIQFLDGAFESFSTFELRQSRDAVMWENAVLQHDNARPHISNLNQGHIASKNCVLLPQTPYSPDTNILDRFIFPKLEMERTETTFPDRNALNEYLAEAIQNLTPEMIKR